MSMNPQDIDYSPPEPCLQSKKTIGPVNTRSTDWILDFPMTGPSIRQGGFGRAFHPVTNSERLLSL